MAGRSNPYPVGISDPFPAGRVIAFGSLEFRATGNGYLMQLLSPGRNPVTPTSPARRNRRSGQRSRQARANVRDRLGPTFATATTPPRGSRLAYRNSASRPTRPPHHYHVLRRRLRRHRLLRRHQCSLGGVRPRHHPSLSGCVTLPPASFRSALTSPGVRICWVTIFGRFAASSRRLQANPTLRRRARSPTTSTSS